MRYVKVCFHSNSCRRASIYRYLLSYTTLIIIYDSSKCVELNFLLRLAWSYLLCLIAEFNVNLCNKFKSENKRQWWYLSLKTRHIITFYFSLSLCFWFHFISLLTNPHISLRRVCYNIYIEIVPGQVTTQVNFPVWCKCTLWQKEQIIKVTF